MTPWRFVTTFGVVALLCDIVYEGARSVTGPYLGTLGASAAAVGLITGVGEAIALAGRLGTGPLADRDRSRWPLVLIGYGMTVVAVPLIGLTSALWVVAALIILERAGKAVRSPAKDVMLSHASSSIGRGRGFAVHEAIDQIGGFAGPLLFAGILAWTAGSYRTGFLALAIPGAAVMLLLIWLRKRMPDTLHFEPSTPDSGPLPKAFWRYLVFTILTTSGYATFGVIGFHLAQRNVLPMAMIPVLYAAVMAVDAIAALASGWLYDRIGRRVLLAVPLLAALIPLLAFTTSRTLAICGALVWGVVLGIQESTMRAAVADLVPTTRRGTAYGVFAAGFGVATLIGGLLTGFLYDRSITTLVLAVATLQLAAFILAIWDRKPAHPLSPSTQRPTPSG